MPPENELLNEIRRLYRLLGRRPKIADLKEHGRYSKKPYYTEFGSWNEAVQMAGIDGPDAREYDISRAGLLAEIERLAGSNDGVVTRPLMNEQGAYAASTYEKRFESWSAAVMEAGAQPGSRPAEEVECDQCGTVFERAPAHLEREWTTNTFCSTECFANWREGNIIGEDHPQWDPESTSEYGPNWQSKREEAIQRDDEECVNCGCSRSEHLDNYGRDLHVHHITPRSAFGDVADAHSLENLVTVCCVCHQFAESSEVELFTDTNRE